MPIAPTAATASMTLPGPTGSPAARNVRAKCIRLASSRPGSAPARPSPSRWRGSLPLPACGERAGVRGSSVTISRPRRGGLGLDLLQEPGGFAAVQAGDVVLVFEQDTQRVVDRDRKSTRLNS